MAQSSNIPTVSPEPSRVSRPDDRRPAVNAPLATADHCNLTAGTSRTALSAPCHRPMKEFHPYCRSCGEYNGGNQNLNRERSLKRAFVHKTDITEGWSVSCRCYTRQKTALSHSLQQKNSQTHRVCGRSMGGALTIHPPNGIEGDCSGPAPLENSELGAFECLPKKERCHKCTSSGLGDVHQQRGRRSNASCQNFNREKKATHEAHSRTGTILNAEVKPTVTLSELKEFVDTVVLDSLSGTWARDLTQRLKESGCQGAQSVDGSPALKAMLAGTRKGGDRPAITTQNLQQSSLEMRSNGNLTDEFVEFESPGCPQKQSSGDAFPGDTHHQFLRSEIKEGSIPLNVSGRKRDLSSVEGTHAEVSCKRTSAFTESFQDSSVDLCSPPHPSTAAPCVNSTVPFHFGGKSEHLVTDEHFAELIANAFNGCYGYPAQGFMQEDEGRDETFLSVIESSSWRPKETVIDKPVCSSNSEVEFEPETTVFQKEPSSSSLLTEVVDGADLEYEKATKEFLSLLETTEGAHAKSAACPDRQTSPLLQQNPSVHNDELDPGVIRKPTRSRFIAVSMYVRDQRVKQDGVVLSAGQAIDEALVSSEDGNSKKTSYAGQVHGKMRSQIGGRNVVVVAGDEKNHVFDSEANSKSGKTCK